MLSISGESEHPCLVPDLRGNAISFSPLRVMFAVVLSNQGYGFSSGHDGCDNWTVKKAECQKIDAFEL